MRNILASRLEEVAEGVSHPRFLVLDELALRFVLSLPATKEEHITAILKDHEARDSELWLPNVRFLPSYLDLPIEEQGAGFDAILSLSGKLDLPGWLPDIGNAIRPTGNVILKIDNARFHVHVSGYINGHSNNLEGGRKATLNEIERKLHQSNLDIDFRHDEYGAGHQQWLSGGKRLELDFGAFQYRCADVDSAEEFFVTCSTFFARPAKLPTQRVLVVVLQSNESSTGQVHRWHENRISVELAGIGSDETLSQAIPSSNFRQSKKEQLIPGRELLKSVEDSAAEFICVAQSSVTPSPFMIDELEAALSDSPDNLAVGPLESLSNSSQFLVHDYHDNDSFDSFAWKQRRHRALANADALSSECILLRKEDLKAIPGLAELEDARNLGVLLAKSSPNRRCLIASNAYAHCGAGLMKGAEETREFEAKLLDEKCMISLCMIVRDNAPIIRNCLDSISPWVDEMIVVDTGSTDATPKICEELGAKVFHFPWCDDFSAARNESLRHASGEWIFWMDSDDICPSEQGRKLRQLVRNEIPAECGGFVMRVHCPGSDGQLTAVDHVKVFRNHPEHRFQFRIHEQILPSIRRTGGQIVFTDLHVVHLGSKRKGDEYQGKLERDFRLLELEAQDRPDHPFVLFNLGMTCEDVGRYQEAVDHLEQSIQLASPGESHVPKAWALLVSCYQSLGQNDLALEKVRVALEQHQNDTELLFRRAMLLQNLGQPAEALQDYEAIIGLPKERTFRSMDTAISGGKALHNMAGCLRQLNRKDEAIDCYRRAIEDVPQLVSAWLGLSELYFQRKDATALLGLAGDVRLNNASYQWIARLIRCRGREMRGDKTWVPRMLSAMWERTRKTEFIHELAAFHRRNRQPESAAQVLRDAMDVAPLEESIYMHLAKLLTHLEEPEEASRVIRRGAEQLPNSDALKNWQHN